MRRFLIFLGAAAACVLAVAISVLAVPVGQTSWADSTHGWKAGIDRKRNVGLVLSTEDGGCRWHRIGTGLDVAGLVRTSASAGVDVAGVSPLIGANQL